MDILRKLLSWLFFLILCSTNQDLPDWVVEEKATGYGGSVTLFCAVEGCCDDAPGWDAYEPERRAIYIDVRGVFAKSTSKYATTVRREGFTLTIRNLTTKDLNIKYGCTYGFKEGTPKILLEQDVFKNDTTQSPTNAKTGLIIGCVFAAVTVLFIIGVVIVVYRRKTRQDNNEIGESEDFLPKNNQDDEAKKGEETQQCSPSGTKEKEESANISMSVRKWKEDDKKSFIDTKASRHVLKSILENRCVTVIGPSGVGKTATVRHTAVRMQEKGFDVIPFYDCKEITDHMDHNTSKPTLFVMDDICGNFTLNQHSIDCWDQSIDRIEDITKDHENVKVLVSCRSQIFLDKRFQSMDFFSTCVCNLVSDELSLDISEKREIAAKYLRSEVNFIRDNFENFPLLCRLFKENESIDIENFFQNPFASYEKDLEKLWNNRNNGRNACCALLLCILYNNNLDDKYFNFDHDEEEKTILRNACDACGLNLGTSKNLFKEELEKMEETFISREGRKYKILHDKLFDFLAYYFGKKVPNCLIKYAHSDFIRERFLWESSSHSEAHEDQVDYTIPLPDEFVNTFIERLLDDWSKGQVVNVFCNRNMSITVFRQRLKKHLVKVEEEIQTRLANTLDERNQDPVLYQSCQYDDIDLIQWILKHGTDVNACGTDDKTPLYVSSDKGYDDLTTKLLEFGAEVNKCDKKNISPLYKASASGHLDVVCKLLSHHADVNIRRISGSTALFMACQGNFYDIVVKLLQHDANVDHGMHNGMSPLFIAVTNGSDKIVTELLKYGADINKCVLNEEQIGDAAFKLDDTLFIDYMEWWKQFIKGRGYKKMADAIEKISNERMGQILAGSSPLHMAAFMGHSDVMETLLDQDGHLINIRNHHGDSPLYLACEMGHEDMVRLLLKNKADPMIRTNDEQLPENIASQYGHHQISSLFSS